MDQLICLIKKRYNLCPLRRYKYSSCWRKIGMISISYKKSKVKGFSHMLCYIRKTLCAMISCPPRFRLLYYITAVHLFNITISLSHFLKKRCILALTSKRETDLVNRTAMMQSDKLINKNYSLKIIFESLDLPNVLPFVKSRLMI